MKKRIVSIEFVRFLAAVGVLFVHTTNRFIDHTDVTIYDNSVLHFLRALGYFGVDYFFILTGFGFVLSTLGKDDFKKPLINFLKQTYPLLVVISIIYMLGASIMLNYHFTFEELLTAIFYIPSFGVSGNSYNIVMILPMGWTLFFQIVFLILGGIVIYFTPKKNYIRYVIMIAIILVFCILAFTKIGEVARNNIYGVPSFGYIIHVLFGQYIYIIEFAFGLLIGMAYKKNYIKPNFIVGLILIIVSIVYLIFAVNNFTEISGSSIPFPYQLRGLIIGIGFSILIVALIMIDHKIKYRETLQYLGSIAYSIYILQGLTIYLFLQYIIDHSWNIIYTLSGQFIIILTIIISTILLAIIEKYIINFRKNQLK